MIKALLAVLVFAGMAFTVPATAQTVPVQTIPAGRIIDSVIVITRDVFEQEEVEVNPVFGWMNAIHVKTRPYVVRRELLFKAGEPLDSAKIEETRRNLNRIGLFRRVIIQPREVAGKLLVYVVTSDGWTTTLGLNARSTGGVFTWSINSSEGNLAGTGNSIGLGYREDVDRNGVNGSLFIPRVGGTRLRTSAFYELLTDGHTAIASFGAPNRSFSDPHSVDFSVSDARHRILQFRDGVFYDSFQQRYQRGTLALGIAPYASSRGYFRLSLIGLVKHEEYIHAPDTLLTVPDTLTGTIGVGLDWRQARFMVVNHLNGFARDEDVDLSARIQTAAWLAPAAFGYVSSGIGPSLDGQVGWQLGHKNFMRLAGHANGLFNSAGLDSGRAGASLTVGLRPISRQATVFFIAGGVQKGLPGGFEFDLGHGTGPRSFGPHAFTGDRTLYGTVEHRVFAIDELGGFMGVGFAAFLDYGGAWFVGEPVRKGGDVGIGLRLGATRATGNSVGRFDLGYRIGDGITGSRWVFSFGRSAPF